MLHSAPSPPPPRGATHAPTHTGKRMRVPHHPPTHPGEESRPAVGLSSMRNQTSDTAYCWTL